MVINMPKRTVTNANIHGDINTIEYPVVIKAHILSGSRQKRGLITAADNKDEAQ